MRIPGVPFRHAVAVLPSDDVEGNIWGLYNDLLTKCRLEPDAPHNILLAENWLLVIPRTTGWLDEIPANAAGMVGMVWCNSEEQYDGWMQRGPVEALKAFGVPWERDD